MSAGANIRAYVTLDRVIRQLEADRQALDSTISASGLIDAQSTNVRLLLKEYIFEVSDELYNLKARDFVPYSDTLSIRRSQLSLQWVSGEWRIDLSNLSNRDLLSIASLTINGTSISASNYAPDDTNGYPAQGIWLDGDNVDSPKNTVNGFSDATVIVGVFGYHEHPDSMWLGSGDTVQDSPLSASATTLNVTDGANFETYSYIKIGDEYLFVESIASNALTVKRGVNGTTASEHANGVSISTYQQTESVSKEIARHVIRAYQLRNGFNIVTAGDTVTDIQQGTFKLDIPPRYVMGGV